MNSLVAQNISETKIDTLVKQDSVKTSKFNRFLKKVLFKKKSNSPTKFAENNFGNHNTLNKPIRNIIINSHEPFGYSLQDTTKKPEKWIERAGNSLHGKTKPFVIRELLLFKKGDRIDSLKIKESERLLRAQRIIRRVDIKPQLSENGDSVDVYVNTLDSWSMLITGSFSTSKIGVRISERNFLGLGHVLYNRYRHNYESGKSLYHFNYTVPNIAKTRIIGSVNYAKNEEDYYNKEISFTRPFFSPLAKWAGGISVGQVFFQDSLDYNREELQHYNFKYNYTDIWGAKAFRVKENVDGKITNFITSVRYYNRAYKENPTYEMDPYDIFSNQYNYFLGLGISSRKYKKDSYIFNNGIIEDIAEGYVFGVTSAIQKRDLYSRNYLGGRVSYGKYFRNMNYFGFDIQYGSFFRNKYTEQTTFNLNVLHFSKLMNMGRWKMRAFSKVNYTVGGHRFDTPADELTLNQNDYNGISGIRRARGLYGDQKLLLEMQLQTYSPYEFLGFRLSPFVNAAMGVIGERKNQLYSSSNTILRIGLGVIFSNDYFIFNNFQISLSYYPKLPGEGLNVLKTNIIDNRDFELMDYTFDKPGYIRWNRWD